MDKGMAPPLINQLGRRPIIAIVHEPHPGAGTIVARTCVSPCGLRGCLCPKRALFDEGYVSVTSLQMQGRNERNTGINSPRIVPFPLSALFRRLEHRVGDIRLPLRPRPSAPF